MIHFLLAFVWLAAVFVSLVMLVFKPLRRWGVMLMMASTLGFFLSLAASILAVLAVGWLADYWTAPDQGIAAIGGYLLGTLGGGVLGVVAGAFAGWRLTRPKRSPVASSVS